MSYVGWDQCLCSCGCDNTFPVSDTSSLYCVDCEVDCDSLIENGLYDEYYEDEIWDNDDIDEWEYDEDHLDWTSE